MTIDHDDRNPSRRKVLECMTWAGTGVLWTIAGGVPHSLGIVGEAMAQASGLTFLQISDSHVGFDKPANPNARGTLDEAVGQDQGPAGKAGLHDPYRRHHPAVEGQRVRRRRPDHLAGAARRASTCPASTISSTRAAKLYQGPLRPRQQGRRLVQLRCQRRALHRPGQRGRSQGRRHRQSRRRAARLAGSRPQGPLGIDADRGVRPHPAVDRLPDLGLGHRRRRPGAGFAQGASAR